MKIVTVAASRVYDVFIGNHLLPKLADYLLQYKKSGKIVIVSDTNVWPIYGNTATEILKASGFEVIPYVFTAGEASKTVDTYYGILNCLAENTITRSDCLIALGGGVVGDITGFAAATFLRGIDYIQIPTSLLAMVDASVGGKTAIDLPSGKNLVGAFWQPLFVLCDTALLSTLPKAVYLDGCAEIIKYAVLFDKEMFFHLQQNGAAFNREEIITKCIEWKRDVVAADEFDTGVRQQLNLGHTIAHGIEKLSNYTISHGNAVAAGIAIVSRAASNANYCTEMECRQICDLIAQFGLPLNTEYAASALAAVALSDKKRTGKTVNLIIPRQVGLCSIHPFPIHELESFIEAGLL